MKSITLKPQYTSNKSFYNKAHVITYDDKPHMLYLKSYDTFVLSYDTTTHTLTKTWNGYSQTTMKHINDFLMQYTTQPTTLTKKQWDALPCSHPHKYKIIARHPFVQSYHPQTTFDAYNDAEQYADKLNAQSNGLWYYDVEEI